MKRRKVRTPVLRDRDGLWPLQVVDEEGLGIKLCPDGLLDVLGNACSPSVQRVGFRLVFSLAKTPGAVLVELRLNGDVARVFSGVPTGCVRAYVAEDTRKSLRPFALALLGREPRVGDRIYVQVEAVK